MEKFIMAGKTAVRYSDFGKGPKTVCILHGYLESIETWEQFGGQLGRNHRVILIDLPGHGMSDWGNQEVITVKFMAEIVAETLKKANVECCCVVGHSMGGYVASALAQLHPTLVESLIMLHSAPHGDTPERAENRQREIKAIQGGKKELLSTTNPGKGFAPQNLRRCAEAIDELSEQIMMTEDEAIIATLRGLSQRPDRTEVVKSMGDRVLFVFGRHDQHIPVETAEQIASSLPEAQTVWLENSGHHSFIEEPEQTLEIIKAFLER